MLEATIYVAMFVKEPDPKGLRPHLSTFLGLRQNMIAATIVNDTTLKALLCIDGELFSGPTWKAFLTFTNRGSFIIIRQSHLTLQLQITHWVSFLASIELPPRIFCCIEARHRQPSLGDSIC